MPSPTGWAHEQISSAKTLAAPVAVAPLPETRWAQEKDALTFHSCGTQPPGTSEARPFPATGGQAAPARAALAQPTCPTIQGSRPGWDKGSSANHCSGTP